MKAWCDANKAGNDILFLADGNASLSKALGLTFDGSMYSLGVRSQRFAMILTGLKVEKLFIEKPGVFDVSSAQKVLGHLS
jgi:peroxiredoxin